MGIEDLVKKPPVALPADATCIEAAEAMREQNVGSIVVADGGKPLGVITDRDLVVRVMARNEDPRQLTVGEVMSKDPGFVIRTRSIDEVVTTMRQLGVRRIPVVDENGELDGLVSMDDLLVAISGQLASLAVVIANEIESES
jgi:CBS domain-containing protein